jgi:hypothetical protein
MTRVKQYWNRCEGDSWGMVGVNQTDDNKCSDHGEHRDSDTVAKKTGSRSYGSAANRAQDVMSDVSVTSLLRWLLPE